MDAIELLRSQHREVEGLFDALEDAEGDRQRELAHEIIRKLEHHTKVEEEIFYPYVRERMPALEGQILEDLEEHHAVELLLEEWGGMQPSHERFAAKGEVIEEQVEHHVEEEEEELFPEVRQRASEEELQELGARMQQRFQELESGAGERAAGDGSGDGRTKQELYEQAQQLDVEGRSQMSKDELAEAVERAR